MQERRNIFVSVNIRGRYFSSLIIKTSFNKFVEGLNGYNLQNNFRDKKGVASCKSLSMWLIDRCSLMKTEALQDTGVRATKLYANRALIPVFCFTNLFVGSPHKLCKLAISLIVALL